MGGDGGARQGQAHRVHRSKCIQCCTVRTTDHCKCCIVRVLQVLRRFVLVGVAVCTPGIVPGSLTQLIVGATFIAT